MRMTFLNFLDKMVLHYGHILSSSLVKRLKKKVRLENIYAVKYVRVFCGTHIYFSKKN